MALAACVPEPYAYNRPPSILTAPTRAASGDPGQPVARPPGRRVAALLPLTGPNAEVGQSLLKAAQLSLDAANAPPLDAQDTQGTPGGAAEAARQALAAGAGLIIGPLTAQETEAVTPIAKAAGVPVLAFTSDTSKAQAGVWTLGITPAQQVRRLVLAVQAEGKSRFAAVVPDNAFGNALADGLNTGTSQAGLPAASVRRYSGNFRNLDTALKETANYAGRRGAQESRPRGDGDAGTRRDSTSVSQVDVPPPPFDALLLGVIGEQLGQVTPLLAAYDVKPDQVRILGPALWSREASRVSGLAGAWYAAPDPAARATFEQRYNTKFGAAPRDLASLSYDAAGIARAAATAGGFDPNVLMRSDGFGGTDGLIGLLPDGQVRRGLAIFEIDRSGSHIVQPAPASLAAPGT